MASVIEQAQTTTPFEPFLTASVGRVGAWTLEDYLSRGGYTGWRRAVAELAPTQPTDWVKQSGLRGRRGAARVAATGGPPSAVTPAAVWGRAAYRHEQCRDTGESAVLPQEGAGVVRRDGHRVEVGAEDLLAARLGQPPRQLRTSARHHAPRT